MGCDQVGVHVTIRLQVSIHAPTWGATQHTFRITILLCFNPRTHMGCDRYTPATSFRGAKVSIHAPTWGATSPHFRLSVHAPVSIHAPTWGATQLSFSTTGGLTLFQSTHPHGVRHYFFLFNILCCVCFNPRTHMGCDGRRLINVLGNNKFQSTHPHGVRLCDTIFANTNHGVSIHAPTWGATTFKGNVVL